MKEVWFGVIVGLPAFVTAYGPFIVLHVMGYRVKRLKRWVATNVFHRIIKTKTDDHGETRWLLKDMDLTDEAEILSKVLSRLFYLFLILFGGVVLLFYQLLLLDVNYRCDHNEKTQDCFKYSPLWNWEGLNFQSPRRMFVVGSIWNVPWATWPRCLCSGRVFCS